MRRYHVELFLALGLYALSLILAHVLSGALAFGPHAPIWLSLLPLPATVTVAWVIWRATRRMDELEIRQQFEAIAIAFTVTALVTFNYGFLEGAGLPKASAFWVWPLMGASWALAGMLVRRRYK